MNRATGSECVYCLAPEDTAEHTIFHCPHWGGIREGMRPFLNGRLPIPEDIADLLCGPVDWLEEGAHIREAVVRANAAFAGMVERILTEKEMDKRAAEREDA